MWEASPVKLRMIWGQTAAIAREKSAEKSMWVAYSEVLYLSECVWYPVTQPPRSLEREKKEESWGSIKEQAMIPSRYIIL